MVERVMFLSICFLCGVLTAKLFIIPIYEKWADDNPKVDEFFDAFFERLGL